MRLAIKAADFSDADANRLRRSMATFKNLGNVSDFKARFVEGMVRRGYEREFSERCFKQIEGFGSYGFPESHAISFALLVYASAWVKWRWPDAFLASLLNSQPMGFYQPAQLVRDAREHHVEVRGPDVLVSDWDCTLEDRPGERLRAVRLGLRQIKGFNKDEAQRLVDARHAGVRTIEDFAVQAGLTRRSLELLAEADAFASLGLSRRQALWAVKGLADETGSLKNAPLLAAMGVKERQVELPLMSLPQEVTEDYRTTSLSLRAHPCGFFRESLTNLGAVKAKDLVTSPDRKLVSVGGLVLVRQRPGTAKGVTFLTLEDETGVANIVVWKDAFDANRRLVMTSSFLVVHGQIQSESNVIHVVARRFTDLSHRLAEMREEPGAEAPQIRNRVTGRLIRSRDFH